MIAPTLESANLHPCGVGSASARLAHAPEARPCAGECSWLFAGSPRQVQEQLRQASRTVRYRMGQLLFHEGEPGFGLYLICAGKVKLTKRTPAGKRLILQLRGPGDVLGAENAFGGDAYIADAQALEDVSLHFIEKSAFLAMMEHAPKVSVRLIQDLSQDLKLCQSKLIETAYESGQERLAHTLMSIARRYGLPRPKGIELGVELTRGELAELAGLTTETTIRILSKLQRRGWIALKGSNIRLLNAKAIEGLVEPGLDVLLRRSL